MAGTVIFTMRNMEMIPYITMEVTAHDDALNNRTLL
jgi:hypothetical protein